MPDLYENCCICVKKCILFQKLSDKDTNKIKFKEKLQVFVPNETWKENYLICADCIEKLNNAYEFLTICLKSEEFRKLDCQMTYESQQDPKQSNITNTEETPFTCHMCNKAFKFKRTLSLHITKIHIRTKKLVKQEPASSNSNEDCFSQEINDFKTDNNILNIGVDSLYKKEEDLISDNDVFGNCLDEYDFKTGENVTEDKTENIEGFEIHKIEEDMKKNHSVKECKVKEKKTTQRAKKKHKIRQPEICKRCNMVFTNMSKYTLHVRIKHNEDQPFHCDECDAKYISKQSLKIHKRKHNNEKPYICSKCGKGFVSSNDLWQHDKIHDVIPKYPCDKCEKSFKTHSNLRTHKHQMHLDPALWKYVCTVCGKKFPLNTNLIKHMRRHEGIKPFCCNLCEKRFVEKVDLQVHLLSHSDERLFKCHLCEKEYKKRETLRRHLKIEHGIGNIKIKKPEKKLACPKCPKLFAFNNKLQRHVLTHTGERPVGCHLCDKRFRDNYDRNMHLKKEHDVQPSY